ncbi:MAG: hypothetical protein IKL84_08255 [Clostridia bacterium]|nr:hypothetical protein [Clostridia bacterium]
MNQIEAEHNQTATDATPSETVPAQPDELEALRAETEQLRAELAAERQMAVQMREFCALYPDTPTDRVPDSVWERVKAGVPLAAAYALHERRLYCERQAAEAAQAESRARSGGAVGGNGGETLFTPAEVRAMSPEEVRSNYHGILASMKRWQ